MCFFSSFLRVMGFYEKQEWLLQHPEDCIAKVCSSMHGLVKRLSFRKVFFPYPSQNSTTATNWLFVLRGEIANEPPRNRDVTEGYGNENVESWYGKVGDRVFEESFGSISNSTKRRWIPQSPGILLVSTILIKEHFSFVTQQQVDFFWLTQMIVADAWEFKSSWHHHGGRSGGLQLVFFFGGG